MRRARKRVLDRCVFRQELRGKVSVGDILVMRGECVALQAEWTYPEFATYIDLTGNLQDVLESATRPPVAITHQYGLRTARHGGLQVTGSYNTGGRSSLCFKGVYKAEIGTTVRVASSLDDGQTFHDSLTPATIIAQI